MKSIVICIGLLLAQGSGGAAPQHAPVNKAARQTSVQQLRQALGNGARILVIDVRSEQEFATGHIPGAVNIPIGELARKMVEMKISKDTRIVTVCDHGGRSSRAVVELQKMGYKTSSFCALDGWRRHGYKIETGGAKPRAAAQAPSSLASRYGMVSFPEEVMAL